MQRIQIFSQTLILPRENEVARKNARGVQPMLAQRRWYWANIDLILVPKFYNLTEGVEEVESFFELSVRVKISTRRPIDTVIIVSYVFIRKHNSQ